MIGPKVGKGSSKRGRKFGEPDIERRGAILQRSLTLVDVFQRRSDANTPDGHGKRKRANRARHGQVSAGIQGIRPQRQPVGRRLCIEVLCADADAE
jgi:hypothetical protein